MSSSSLTLRQLAEDFVNYLMAGFIVRHVSSSSSSSSSSSRAPVPSDKQQQQRQQQQPETFVLSTEISEKDLEALVRLRKASEFLERAKQ